MEQEPKPGKRIYIIGAGYAGRSIASEIKRKKILGTVVAFLDDDPAKVGSSIDRIPVLGPIRDVVNVLRQTPADEAIIAMPSASAQVIAAIYKLLTAAGFVNIRILPSVSQIVSGAAHLIQARGIDPQDLLARSPVTINLSRSLSYLRGKRVLVTGAGGSIGGELARQLLSGGAERLYLFGHGENSIYEIDRELRLLQEEGVGEKATIVPIIGDLKDTRYMHFILKRLKADVVFHCAAYKHVPMTEHNPVESIANNVFGTQNLIEAASQAGCSRMVVISTDKAVDPESVYGASKKIAEEIALQNESTMETIVVRFGNVLGSRGSIVPLFRSQIMKGGPLTVTHKDATRYFMTIPEAASLVLQAGGVGSRGDLYVLDMGEPVKIMDLAEQMIRFHGYEPHRDIPITTIGLRPGEKVHEELNANREAVTPTEYPKINRISRRQADIPGLQDMLANLSAVCNFDPERPDHYRNRRVLRGILRQYIPTVKANESEHDY